MSNKDGTTMNFQQEAVANQAVKIGGIWMAIGITSWAEAASFLAFLLSLAAVCEYLWKKLIRPTLVRYGKLPARKRRKFEDHMRVHPHDSDD